MFVLATTRNNMQQVTETIGDIKKAISQDGLYTAKQAADKLQVDRSTIFRLSKKKGIVPIRVGKGIRYTAEQLAKLTGISETSK